MTIAVKEIKEINNPFVMIVTDGKGNYYVGARFDDGKINRFAASPRYTTINGAIRFAKKRYTI